MRGSAEIFGGLGTGAVLQALEGPPCTSALAQGHAERALKLAVLRRIYAS